MKKSCFTYLKIALTCTLLLSSAISSAQEDIFSMSLEELMNIEVTVGSANKLTLRETPGIITVISSTEIENLGARDLVDLLRLVPGLEFGGEIENILGLGVRGNYALEGKTLFMIDGHQINENGYGSVVFGNRFFIDNIQKIEIIRGPGSAIYGGLAELAVINIITKTGSDIDGAYGSATYGLSEGSTSRLNGQFGLGKKVSEDFEISLTGGISSSNRSNNSIFYETSYDDAENGFSNTFNYEDSSQVLSTDFNFGLKYKDLIIRTMVQQYTTESNTSNAEKMIMGGVYTGIKYDWKISKKLTLTPELSWKKEHPWSYKGNVSDNYENFYVAQSYRSRGNLTGLWKANDHLNITFGVETTNDKAKKSNDANVFSNGETEISYNNQAMYSEALIKSSIANFTLGARLDNHSAFGAAFAPRLGITKAWDKFHIKGLWSRAFKAPVIYNFEADLDINAEFTTVAEVETGIILNEHMSLTGNVFYINVKDPIVYVYFPETDTDTYENNDNASTIGFEIDSRIKYDRGYINTSYSYYRNNNSNVEAYEVADDNKLLRGFPAHKIAMNAAVNIGKKFVLAPTLIFNSKKIGYYYQLPEWEGYDAHSFGNNLTLNLAINYRPTDEILITLGGYDLFNQNYFVVNAYDAGYKGTPTMGREFALKLKFRI